MLLKLFQAFLVTFLVVFTAAGVVLLARGGIGFLLPSNGGWAFVGGISARTFDAVLIIVALLAVAAVFLVARRHRLK